jgi:uncharacterized protein (DUF1778 family)
MTSVKVTLYTELTERRQVTLNGAQNRQLARFAKPRLTLYGNLPYSSLKDQSRSMETQIMAAKDRKGERIETRLPAEAKQQIEFAAELQGRSVSDFVVSAALTEAAKVIEQQKILRLSIEDSVALADAILNPPEPNAKAIAAARRYKQKMGA